MECPKCNNKTKTAVKLISYKGRSTFINIEECEKCNNYYTPLKEAEKARVSLNQTFLERIKNLFRLNNVTEVILKGKVL